MPKQKLKPFDYAFIKMMQETKMRKIIIGIPNCQKCQMLKLQNPDAESVELQPDQLLQFARAVGIQSMPFVCIVGEINELDGVLK